MTTVKTTAFNTLDDLDVAGKRVLVRLDLNVPMADGKVTDLTRIERSVPTVRELSDNGARVVVLAHFGRPKGERNAELTLAPVAAAFAEVLGQDVAFAEDCIGKAASSVVDKLGNGGVALLENIRFHAGEEKNDPSFVKALAELGDIYVNDAFSAAHRAHASTEGLAHVLPAAAGRLMEAELVALNAALGEPRRPVTALVGGAKVSSKLDVLQYLVTKVDSLIIGGGMANTFLYAQGKGIGNSLCEKDLADTARMIMAKAEEAGCTILLPVDGTVAREFKAGAASEVVSVDDCPDDAMILDIGPASIAALEACLADTKTLVWNGPMGAFEIEPFDIGTNAVARAAAAATKAGTMVTVAGGGDTVAALAKAGVVDDFSYVSTAGGAFLEWLEGRELPGVAALTQA
jgi:phosphoglycerate kinase